MVTARLMEEHAARVYEAAPAAVDCGMKSCPPIQSTLFNREEIPRVDAHAPDRRGYDAIHAGGGCGDEGAPELVFSGCGFDSLGDSQTEFFNGLFV